MDLRQKQIPLSEEEGSSLIAVLIVITIISFLVGFVMLGNIIQNRFIQRDIDALQSRYAAEAGLFHYLADSTLPLIPKTDSLQIQLMDGSTFTTIKAEPFGGFLRLTSVAGRGEQRRTIRTLVGERANSLFDRAVVLGDVYSALNLTGNTSIRGDIVTGPLGIRKSPFKGKKFAGSVDGTISREDEPVLPAFNKALFNEEIAYCDGLLKNPPSEAKIMNSGSVNLARIELPEAGSTILVTGDLVLSSSKKRSLPNELTIIVTGNLEMKSDIQLGSFSRFVAGKKLTITENVAGKNSLFYAGKELEVEGKGVLSGQFIAGKNILITGESYLEYPSVAYTPGLEENGIREGRLELSDRAIVEGTLLIPEPEKIVTGENSRLVVGKEARVRGGIYNTAQTELHGKITGSVMTMQFYFYHSPTSYINWLKDVSIDVGDRPENYVVPIGFSENRKFEILDWEEL